MPDGESEYAVQIFERQRDRIVIGAWLAAAGLEDAHRKAAEAAELLGGAAVYHLLRGATGVVLMVTMLAAFGEVPQSVDGVE